MRMTIRIEDEIMKELLTLTKRKKKTEAITFAIADFLKRRGKEKLLDLKGKMRLHSNWRKLRHAELKEE